MTNNCDDYTWKNYMVTAYMTDDKIADALDGYNEKVCE